MEDSDKKKIIVNLITGLRLVATLAIAPIYFKFGGLVTALAMTGFLLTDFIDGKLARKWHVQSFLGSSMDALSDKTLAIVALLALSTVSKLFLIPLAIEAGIVAVNSVVLKNDGNVQANLLGKLKAWFLGAGMTLGFLASDDKVNEVVNKVNSDDLVKVAAAIPSVACGAALVSYCYSLYQTLQEDKVKEVKEEKEKLKKQRKSLEELKECLWNTDYYLEHKDEPLLKLLYKEKDETQK